MNIYLSYNPPSSWRILFWSAGYPRQFSCLKIFRTLVVPGGGFRKGIILQGILKHAGVLPNGESFLRRKGDVTGAYVHEPRHSNSAHVQTIRGSIYETRWLEYPHSPIQKYQQLPQGTASQPSYK